MQTCYAETMVVQMKTLTTQNTPFGQWLRSHRQSRGLTMESLADASNITQAMVSNLERGTRNPSRETINSLSRALSPQGADERTAQSMLNAGLRAAGFASFDESAPRPMMTFIEQQLRLLPHGTVNSLTPAEADQLVSELEELAALRIAQVQRQGKS